METNKLLNEYKLSRAGLTPEELKKPLVVIAYEQGCENLLADAKYGVIANECSAVFAPLPRIDSFNASNIAKQMLLPSREAIADLTEALLCLNHADGALIVAATDICLAGAVMGAVRKNVPLAVLPLINSCTNKKEPLVLKALAESGKIGQETLESELCLESQGMDDFKSLAMFFTGAELCQPDVFSQNKTVLARSSGALAAKRTADLSYPKKDFELNRFNNGLAALLNAGGSCSSLLHVVAIARENGMEVDLDYICSIAAKISLSDSDSTYRPVLIKGNVADSGIIRCNSAQKPFKGAVMAYESEELARAAIFGGTDLNNSAIVITSQSAKDNGMPPLDIESALSAVEAENTIIVTDGRLCELGLYPSISLIDKTEAFDIIRTGDTLEIDLKKGKINLALSAKEISTRLKKYAPAHLKSTTLTRYAATVSDCFKGCTSKK